MKAEREEAFLKAVVTPSGPGKPNGGGAWASAVYLSRAHFQRAFRETVGETPGRLQRRLMLERAAYNLRVTDTPIVTIAFAAGYQTHEGFTRAFRRAFHLAPRAYRNAARRVRDLPGGSGVHFDPASPYFVRVKGTHKMDLTDRLLTSDLQAKRRLLEAARLLGDRQLDAPLAFMPWVEPTRTLRESLSRITYNGWVDVMFDRVGWEPADTAFRTIKGDEPAQMLARFESYHAAFRAFVEHTRTENLWSKEWVDDTCDEPHTFSLGQIIEETLTWEIAYRSLLAREIEAQGF